MLFGRNNNINSYKGNIFFEFMTPRYSFSTLDTPYLEFSNFELKDNGFFMGEWESLIIKNGEKIIVEGSRVKRVKTSTLRGKPRSIIERPKDIKISKLDSIILLVGTMRDLEMEGSQGFLLTKNNNKNNFVGDYHGEKIYFDQNMTFVGFYDFLENIGIKESPTQEKFGFNKTYFSLDTKYFSVNKKHVKFRRTH